MFAVQYVLDAKKIINNNIELATLNNFCFWLLKIKQMERIESEALESE